MDFRPRWPVLVMKRSARGVQSAPNLGYSRIPSVSRAISAICHRLDEHPLQVEFVGGNTRWRFVEDDYDSDADSSRKSRFSPPKASSRACLHEVTIAGGWGQKSEREKRLEKLAEKLGYRPGMPRQKGAESVNIAFFFWHGGWCWCCQDKCHIKIINKRATKSDIHVRPWSVSWFGMPQVLKQFTTAFCWSFLL